MKIRKRLHKPKNSHKAFFRVWRFFKTGHIPETQDQLLSPFRYSAASYTKTLEGKIKQKRRIERYSNVFTVAFLCVWTEIWKTSLKLLVNIGYFYNFNNKNFRQISEIFGYQRDISFMCYSDLKFLKQFLGKVNFICLKDIAKRCFERKFKQAIAEIFCAEINTIYEYLKHFSRRLNYEKKCCICFFPT